MNLTQATKTYLAAKQAAEEADKAKKIAETQMKAAFAEAGITYNVVDGQKVSVNSKGRRNVDVATLAQMIGKSLLAKVTKPTIDAKAFDAAVTIGKITPEVAEAVTKITEYDEVRVTNLATETEGIATTKVA